MTSYAHMFHECNAQRANAEKELARVTEERDAYRAFIELDVARFDEYLIWIIERRGHPKECVDLVRSAVRDAREQREAGRIASQLTDVPREVSAELEQAKTSENLP